MCACMVCVCVYACVNMCVSRVCICVCVRGCVGVLACAVVLCGTINLKLFNLFIY